VAALDAHQIVTLLRSQANKIEACVFRTIVTGRFGIVTAEFGNVTGDSGSVTDALSAPAQVAVVELSRGRCWCCV